MAMGDTPDRIVLRPVPVRGVQACDRTSVIQESFWIPSHSVELEVVADVVSTSARIVDVDLVAYVIAEAGEVRPVGWLFESDVVGDDCDRVRLVGADKSVQVSIIGSRVLAD